MMMEEKITIIEGPTPAFEIVQDVWANGIVEGPNLSNIAVTHLRTFNGPELVERCHRAWRNKQPITLEYRAQDGLTKEVPIIAARHTAGDEGQLIFLWLRLPEEEIEIKFHFDDESDDDDFDIEL